MQCLVRWVQFGAGSSAVLCCVLFVVMLHTAVLFVCTQSQDVISYFTQHGHSAHKKLFYLNKKKREQGLAVCACWWLWLRDGGGADLNG